MLLLSLVIDDLRISHNRRLIYGYFNLVCDYCAVLKVEVSIYWPPIMVHYGICTNRLLESEVYTGDPRPCISPRVMASSAMGLKLGVFGFFPDHTCKNKRNTNASTIFLRRAAFNTCLSLH